MVYAKYKDKICPNCHAEMRLKEIKVKCDGSQDEIYECKFCGCEKEVKVRYEQIVSIKEVVKDKPIDKKAKMSTKLHKTPEKSYLEV